MKIHEISYHRSAQGFLNTHPTLNENYQELLQSIDVISEQELAHDYTVHNTRVYDSWADPDSSASSKPTPWVSLSHLINSKLDKYLVSKGWDKQSPLFNSPGYNMKRETSWRLDFSKSFQLEGGQQSGIAVEVAFNHGEAIAWNLLKPVIAAERNHIKKGIDIGGDGIGVIIAASQRLKKAGLFDGAVGTYEKFLRYLKPMEYKLSVPLVIIGLGAPETFVVKSAKLPNSKNKKYGVIEYL
jgi:hypothetical protein